MANKRLNAVITIGGAITGGLKSALGTAERGVGKVGAAVRSLERDQNRLGASIRRAMQNGKPIADLTRKYRALSAEIAKARREQERMARMEAGKAQIGSAVGGLATVGAVAATALVPITQAASFETAMLGVAKQVDGARDKAGKLTAVYYDMGKAIQMMGREIPIATNELAEMVEAGARMGIGKDMGVKEARKELLQFTRVTAEMATALQLPRAELADDMGKIANLYKMPIAAMRDMGDAINYLDDNAISKGGDIIAFLRRTGGVAGAVKVTGKNMAALGSTLLSLGEPAETASTATNAFFQKLAAADKGTKKFKAAMREIGMSTAKVQKGMQIDAQGTVLQVIEAVNRLPKEKRLGALVDIVGLEHSDTLAKLVGGIGEYRRQIELVNSQKAAGSMGREFQANLETANAQWEITKNRLTEVGVNLGTVLLPVVNDFLGKVGAVASATADWARENPELVKSIAQVGGVIVTATAAWKAMNIVIGVSRVALAGVAILQGRVAATSTAATAALNAETVAMNRQAIAGGKLAAAKGLAGKALGGFVAADLALAGARAAGLPDVTDETQKRGEQQFRNGEWLKASTNMSAGSFLGAVWNGGVPDKKRALGGPGNTGDRILVGESGPEIVEFGARGNVVPAHKTRQQLGGASGDEIHFHITQMPGESADQLADRVVEKLERRKRTRSGGSLYDKPRGY